MGRLILQTNEPPILTSVLGLLGLANPLTVLSFTDESIGTCSMDVQHILVEVAKVSQKLFGTYNLTKESETFNVGTNTALLLGWMGRVSEKGEIIWKVDNEKHEVLLIGEKGKDRKLTVAVTKGIIEYEPPEVENPFGLELVVDAEKFLKILGDCAVGGTELIMRFGEDSMIFETGEFSSGHIKINTFFDSEYLVQPPKLDEDIKELRVSLPYLDSVMKNLSRFGNSIRIQYGLGNPIKINVAKYTLPVVEELDFYLSPIVPPEV